MLDGREVKGVFLEEEEVLEGWSTWLAGMQREEWACGHREQHKQRPRGLEAAVRLSAGRAEASPRPENDRAAGPASPQQAHPTRKFLLCQPRQFGEDHTELIIGPLGP